MWEKTVWEFGGRLCRRSAKRRRWRYRSEWWGENRIGNQGDVVKLMKAHGVGLRPEWVYAWAGMGLSLGAFDGALDCWGWVGNGVEVNFVKMLLNKMNFKPYLRSLAQWGTGAASRWLCHCILCHGSLETLYLTEYLTQHVFSYGSRATLSSFSLPM